MGGIYIRGFAGPWKKVDKEDALIFVKDIYKALPFRGQKAIDEINEKHLKGMKVKFKGKTVEHDE